MDNRPIIQEITARIEDCDSDSVGDDAFSVFYDGKAGPGVSSGSQFGGCFGAQTKKEAVTSMKRIARDHAEWLLSYRNPDTDEVYKIDRQVITKLIIDGVLQDINETANLTDFF